MPTSTPQTLARRRAGATLTLVAAGLLTLPAVAAAPPGVDLEDVDGWEARSKAFDEGPDGCWELEGTLELRLMLDAGASSFGRRRHDDTTVHGTVSARFDDHTWKRFHYTLDQERQDWMIFRPFWGNVEEDAILVVDKQGNPVVTAEERREAAERRRSFRIGRKAADDGKPQVTISSLLNVIWDEQAREVVFEEDGNIRGLARGKAIARHRFPEGSTQATAFDITLPEGGTFGVWPLQGTLTSGSVHIRSYPTASGAAIPHHQRFSAIVQVFGQTVGVDSSLAFTTARRCVPEALAAPPADPTPPAP